MSMLSTQIDNLRLMARLVREYDYDEISRMLREAADTIESLRDKAQAAFETCSYDFVPNVGNGMLNACGLKCSHCGREQMDLEPPAYCPRCGRRVDNGE